jgi:hypothetical protein
MTSFDIGKLKIAAHVREELERLGIAFQSIQCKSGGPQIPKNVARLIVTVGDVPCHLDLLAQEVEECESIVAGDPWRKIAELIGRLP